jgi:hypothetical protein
LDTVNRLVPRSATFREKIAADPAAPALAAGKGTGERQDAIAGSAGIGTGATREAIRAPPEGGGASHLIVEPTHRRYKLHDKAHKDEPPSSQSPEDLVRYAAFEKAIRDFYIPTIAHGARKAKP